MLRVKGTRRRTIKLMDWMVRVRSTLVAHQGELASYLPGDTLARFDELHGSISAALGNQQLARRRGPAFRQAMLESGVRVLRGIAQIRLAARVAFSERPSVLRQFLRGDAAVRTKAVPGTWPAQVIAITRIDATLDVAMPNLAKSA